MFIDLTHQDYLYNTTRSLQRFITIAAWTAFFSVVGLNANPQAPMVPAKNSIEARSLNLQVCNFGKGGASLGVKFD